MSLCVCTIVSANYLAYAAVLAASVRQHHPDGHFEVLVVDRPTPAVQEALAKTGLKARFAQDLGLPDFEQLAYQFDILELNTALKPSFLKQLLREGHEQLVYLDPDIRCYAPLTPVLEGLERKDVLLTPHALLPVLDGHRPSDIDFLRNGVHNLGFVALRQSACAEALLDWWESRCLSHGFNDPAFGVFVDQKWMDLAPACFDGVGLLRHPGCNVAYWNLHERQLTQEAAQGPVQVNGQGLFFFHFSGIDVGDTSVLSRHQTRHSLAQLPVVQRLLEDYVQALREAGHLSLRGLPYGFGTLDDGTPIHGLMRRALPAMGPQEQRAARPFAAASAFQQELRKAGMHGIPAGGAVHTRNLHMQGRRLTLANALIRGLARVMGLGRLQMLLRYAAFLSRESHLPAVLLRRPFQMDHRGREEAAQGRHRS